MVWKEFMQCLLDYGRIRSDGRFVTRLGETIEVGSCPFDGSISGFRWDDEAGWEPVFLHGFDKEGVVELFDCPGGNPYTEQEIRFELDCYWEERRSRGPASLI